MNLGVAITATATTALPTGVTPDGAVCAGADAARTVTDAVEALLSKVGSAVVAVTSAELAAATFVMTVPR